MMGGENGISSKPQLMGSLSSYLQENKYNLSPSSELLYNNEERIDCQEKQLEVESMYYACLVHAVSVPSLYLPSFVYHLVSSISWPFLQY